MTFLHSILSLFHTWPGKIMAGVFGLGTAMLAIGEASSDRTLIIVSVITSITTMLGVIISALVSVHNSRKLDTVAKLPQQVGQLSINLDGRLQELIEAKQAVSKAEGVAQERTEERGRQGEAAIGQHVATASPTPVVVENTKENPANVKNSE